MVTTPNLGDLYLRTLVSIEEDGQMIPAAESSMARNVVLYVLTAWNPGHERPTRDQNEGANRLLHHRLVERGLQPIRAVGADPNSGHFEESWAVIGLDDREARAIGAEFGQVAVFRIANGTQTVLACIENWSLSRPL
jgi:hypothetical protein